MPLSASAALRLGASGGCVRRVRGSGVRAGFYFGGSGLLRVCRSRLSRALCPVVVLTGSLRSLLSRLGVLCSAFPGRKCTGVVRRRRP